MILRTLGVLIALSLASHVLQAASTGIHGRVTDPAGFPLPGVTIALSRAGENAAGAETVASAQTDQNGDYTFEVPAGQYALTVELSGFQIARRVVDVETDFTTADISLALAPFQDSVTITAETTPPSLLAAPQPNAPVTVSRTVISSAMLPNSRYEDVLTLMPTVERGPDNRISVGGAPAATGALVVNGFNETDPADGLPGVVVPVDAVASVDVHTGGFAADLGRATSGVTSIQTRAGADQFHTSVDSIFPRLLFEDGGIHGVEYWEPNIGASGPIVKKRLFFESALSYRYDKYRFETLAGPERSTYNQPLFWSQLDGVISSRQHVRFAVAADQQHTDHAHITAFTPDTTVPKLAEDGWSVMLSDRLTLAHNTTLELNGSFLRTAASVEPNGSGTYLLGHALAIGAYFDDQSRRGRRVEGGATFVLMPTNRQVLKVGGTVDRAMLEEVDAPSPVSLLRTDDSVSRMISFLPAPASRATTLEEGVFIEDAWSPRPSLVLNAGLRYDRFGAIGNNQLSPRLAWTLKRGNERTSISGSAGLFVDKLVLAALAFPEFPTRVVQQFDAFGAALGTPQSFANVVDGSLSVPHALRWDLGLDRAFAKGWIAHLRYQERYGTDELILQPSQAPSGISRLALSSAGRSIERGFETTIGYQRPDTGHEFYVSYVRSAAHGDLNTFEGLEGLSKDPFVQTNQVGPLATELPNRLLAWGLLRLPGAVTFAPFLTLRNGFPYSAIDDDWVYVGARNGLRMPWFTSLDISVTRVVDLPRQLPHARVGLKLYNVISTNSEREIQRDVASPDFGVRYDPVPRDFSLVCVFLLGHS